MKILLVHNTYQEPTGEDVVFSQERQLLERAGHQVLTYCRSNWEISDYSGLKRPALVGRMVWARDSRREIASLLQRQKPDLVHVHNTFMMVSPSLYSACKEAHIPVIQTLHNFRIFCPAAKFFRDGQVCEDCVHHSLWRTVAYSCYRHSRAATTGVALMLAVHRWLGTWMRLVDCYIALTEFSRKKFTQAGLPAEKILLKPNFLSPDPGARQGAGEYALFVGRLSEEKGPQTLLAAWGRLNSCVPLEIVGDGPLHSELQNEAQRCMMGSIHFCGRMPRDRTIAVIRQARFLIFPSEAYETFGLVAIEAFACGVPVIASRLGAMEEIVDAGRTGLHFRPGDAEDLAAKVEWAWTHPKEMEVMGLEARAEYEAKYTAARNYQMLMEIYQRAITAQRGSAPRT